MKKLISHIITLTLCLALTQGCGVKPPSLSDAPIMDTPVRVGEQGTAQASLVRAYSLEEAVEESDLVADITIVSWLYEETHGGGSLGSTYFKVKSNAIFKGKPLGEFVMRQSASSVMTFDDHPLFKIGDRLIIFSYSIDDSEHGRMDWIRYDDTYNLIAEWTSVLHVEEVDGDLFLIDREKSLSRGSPDPSVVLYPEISVLDEALEDEVISERDARDPLLARKDWRTDAVLFYDKAIELIDEIEGDTNI